MRAIGWAWLAGVSCAPTVTTENTNEGVATEALVERAARHPGRGTPACGSVLTRSTRLSGDVGPCTGDGLTLGANDITLDCDGHTIRGTPPGFVPREGPLPPSGGTAGTGIVVEGRADVHIRNCRIEGFAGGISLNGSIGGTVERNRVQCTLGYPRGAGLFLQDAVGVRVERNDIRGCFAGIRVVDATVLDIVRNTIADIDYGIQLDGDVQGVRVRENRVRHADLAIVTAGAVIGNRFEENELSDGLIGVATSEDAVGNRYAHNFVHDMHIAGFALADSRAVFEHNVVLDNEGRGFWALPGTTRSHFEDNEVYDNGGEGFLFAIGADDNVLEENEACDNTPADAAQAGGIGNRLIDNDFCIVTGF